MFSSSILVNYIKKNNYIKLVQLKHLFRDYSDNLNNSLLMISIIYNASNPIIDLFLKDDITKQNNMKQTALMLSVMKYKNNLIKKLVVEEHGMKDNSNKTALIYAVLYKNIKAIDILTSYQSELRNIDINYFSSLMYSVFSNNYKIIKKIIQYENCLQDKYGNTALMLYVNKIDVLNKNILLLLSKYESGIINDKNQFAIDLLINKNPSNKYIYYLYKKEIDPLFNNKNYNIKDLIKNIYLYKKDILKLQCMNFYQKINNSSNTCCICLTNNADIIFNVCSHNIICEQCLQNYTLKYKICPLCKLELFIE